MESGEQIAQHLQKVGALVGSGDFGEAEGEILRVLEVQPGDLRALKLLALVRFKLGRFTEAREAYQKLAAAAPDDAAVRLNLGLIALKLDWVDEAVAELEIAVRLRPDDQQAWGYLGYAHVRAGRRSEAANAFRYAGQEKLAVQAESGVAPEGMHPEAGASPVPASESPVAQVSRVDAGASMQPAAISSANAQAGQIEVEGFALGGA